MGEKPRDGESSPDSDHASGSTGPLGGNEEAGAGRNLLLGLLAFQDGFIGHNTLVDAIHAWIADKSRPIGETLRGWGVLDEGQLLVLTLQVDRDLESRGSGSKGPGKIESTLSLLDEPGPLPVGEDRRRPPEAEAHRALAAGRGGEAPECRYRKPAEVPDFSGGLGDLFIAEDLELGRQVALKEIRPRDAFNLQTRARFLLEGEVTGNLEHPGIVPVYGLGQYADGRPYYAMRLIKGKNLKETVDDSRREHPTRKDPEVKALGLRKLLRRFIDACNAIEYAHSREVLHRDLKPANIMLGKFGETLVVDWGLAKLMGRPDAESETVRDGVEEGPLLTSSSMLVEPTQRETAHGTLQYMSPEQALGRVDQLGPASDVHGLGSTLYYILTGRAPFPDKDVKRIVKGDFARPVEVDPEVPGALEAICLKAMATRPEDRYPSAIALADDVERWLGDQPVSAYRYPLAARAARWVRRHRPFVAGAAALLVTASVALTASNVLIRRENAKTEANFRLANRAIDQMLVRVSEEKLIFQPGLIELRATLVDEARKFYEDLVRDRLDDPKMRLKAAMIDRQEANNLRMSGQFARSLEFSGRAVAAYEALGVASPDDPTYLDNLGHAVVDHGDGLWMVGRTPEAIEAYRRVIRAIEPRLEARPGDRRLPLPLGRAYLGLGEPLLEAGDLPGAGRAYEESIRHLTDLLRAKDSDFLSRLFRSLALCGRGIVARQEGRGPDAERAFDDALGDLARLGPRPGKNPDVEHFRALVLNALGESLAPDPARRPAAWDAFDEAAAIAQGLRSRFATTVEYRLEHAAALIGRASIPIEAGQAPAPEVAGDLQAAREILETLLKEIPDLPKARARLARLLTLKGRFALELHDPTRAESRFKEASEEWKRALDAQPSNPSYRDQLDRSLRSSGGPSAQGPR